MNIFRYIFRRYPNLPDLHRQVLHLWWRQFSQFSSRNLLNAFEPHAHVPESSIPMLNQRIIGNDGHEHICVTSANWRKLNNGDRSQFRSMFAFLCDSIRLVSKREPGASEKRTDTKKTWLELRTIGNLTFKKSLLLYTGCDDATGKIMDHGDRKSKYERSVLLW